MPPQSFTHWLLAPWFRSKTSLPPTVEPIPVNTSITSLPCTPFNIGYAALRFFFQLVFPVSRLYFSIRQAVNIVPVPGEPNTACPSPTSNPPSCPYKQPPTDVVEAFKEFIQNDIPARLIDTSNFTFVERSTVFKFFWPEIVKVTDEDVMKRMGTLTIDTHPEAGIYVTQAQRKAALREIIRDVVQYAIFSHRWTDSEPTYQDIPALASLGRPTLSKQRGHKKAGFAKLMQLCDTARSLGYKLVWSDTCCIDKTNAVELSEAIHAMFKWYAHAHVCIVHLGASLSLKDFWHEPWFKRGWTLQELLAPRRIKFYNKAWNPLTTSANDKDDEPIMIALSDVTGIPRNVVVADNSQGVKGHGVWEIMSWASTRKTTRIEDAAYCLIGLFDVSIHIVYGEGEKAFLRLLDAIVAKRPSWDIFAWAGQASKTHSALPCSPECYSKWDSEITNGEEVGMMKFSFTPHGLHLTSVPLIPMVFAEEVKKEDGSYTAILRPRIDGERAMGKFGEVCVDCGKGRLAQIRAATDLHVCILNYKPSLLNRDRGELQVGRTYVCFLLHMESRSADGSAWLKFMTDNVLRIDCTGVPGPERTSVDSICEGEDPSIFDLQLKITRIREPRAQTTLWT